MEATSIPPPAATVEGSNNHKEKANPSHPPYEEMIYTAIGALKEKDGSSKRAIGKYIEQVYKDLPPTHSALLTHHLNRLKSSNLLVMVKKSYKLPGSASDPIPIPMPMPMPMPMPIPIPVPLPASHRTRGRPPKPKPSDPVWASLGLSDSLAAKRRPGRPKKIGPLPTPNPAVPARRGRPPGSVRSKLPKRPGRPPKPKSVSAISSGLKRRPGRPPKSQSNPTVIPFAPPVAAPAQPPAPPVVAASVPNGSPRPRGRPRKTAPAPAPPPGLVSLGPAVGGRGRGRPKLLPVMRQGRPPKLAVGRPKNTAARPVGRPKGATAAAITAHKAANEDLRKKLEHFQSKVKESLGMLKPYFNHESPVTAIAAIQELEVLSTLDLKAPLRDETQQQPQPQPQPHPHPQTQVYEQQYHQMSAQGQPQLQQFLQPHTSAPS
ncbi:hypothetical protein Fmac_003639 [Flemingia macrophylla]|uniref:H15 domain-containing protein n=1 Tax=Flemingia macrophylla TaxID=520843 RepID=A0ABD1N2Q8_9FABA